MLSVAKLTPGQERYYEQSVAAGLDDYYAGRGESPGLWVGRGAAELELDGIVDDGQLGRLIGGRHPLTSAVLRGHPPKRRITVERIETATGRRWLERKTLAPVAGFDLVFSVPKSVSLLHALGDEQIRLEVVQAHDSAWRAALAYLEEGACVLRRGKNGVRREHGQGFVAAAYQHRTSRAQDPHLHTHVIVANMARSPSDGEWRALDGEAILKTYRLAAGYLYEAQLRYELSRRLGVEWATPERGWAELAGVPRAVIDAFARRRAQVVEHLAEQSTSGFYAAKVAAVATRERKEEIDLPRLREEWAARAAEHGLGRQELDRLIGRVPTRQPSPAELLASMEQMLGPEGLTEKQTSFAEPELAMAWAKAHAQGAPVGRIRELCERSLALGGVRKLSESAPGRPARYSTDELLRIEQQALDLVERGHSTGAPAIPAAVIAESLRNASASLSAEQKAVVRAVASTRDRVVCVIGPAGTGKTVAAHAVAAAYRAANVPVLGAAPSGIAAERLQDETGIASQTLHRLRASGARGEDLPEGCVLIVDEAGMAETRVLAPALAAVERAGGKAVLIGDPRQLPAVGAGGLFAAIVERQGALELSENQRQQDAIEQRALRSVREGRARDYLAFADQRGRLIIAADPIEARSSLLGDWWQHARTDLAGNVMLAHRRNDVAELNALARALLESEGRLGRKRLEVGGQDFRVGDRVVCRRNSLSLDLRNGTLGTIHAVEPARGTLILGTDRGTRVELTRAYLEAGHVEHAYALTGHAAQGLTVDRAFLLGSAHGQLQEWGYVGLSRARTETRLYLAEETVSDPETHAHEIRDSDALSRLARAFESSGAEPLAVEHGEPSANSRPQDRVVLDRSKRTSSELRFLEQDRLTTEKLRAGAERRLAEAERALSRLPFVVRGRRRDDLRTKVRLERQTLRAAAGKLEQLEQRLADAKSRASLERTKQPTRRERAQVVEREPQLGLDL